MANDRVEYRKQGFKSRGLTGDESRRRREEASVEIRKVKREESLNKKRMGAMDAGAMRSVSGGGAHSSDDEFCEDDFGMGQQESDVLKEVCLILLLC